MATGNDSSNGHVTASLATATNGGGRALVTSSAASVIEQLVTTTVSDWNVTADRSGGDSPTSSFGNFSVWCSDENRTENASGCDETTTAGPSPSEYQTWQVVLIAFICSVIIVGTIVGNILICTAVAIVRRLRTPSNLLIVSLAVSDLLVAILDMPFATMYEVLGYWPLGQAVCDTWTSLDVLLCTASILNLCMISVDRYFVITRPFQYAMKRTPFRMAMMIVAVWTLSAVISIPPLFGWKAPSVEGMCILSQVGHCVLSSVGTTGGSVFS